jgi:hypothetical protein
MVSKWLRRTPLRRSLFAGVVLAAIASVGSLGWRVLSQDRQKRLTEDREVAADLVVAAFDQRLSALERTLDEALAGGEFRPVEPVVDGTVLIRISAEGIHTSPAHRLRYYPYVSPQPASPELDSLVQRAQGHLRAGDFARALDLYHRLSTFGAQPIGDVVGGIPAGLFSYLGRLTVYSRQRDSVAGNHTAQELSEALRSSRWHVSAATYAFLIEQTRQGRSAQPDVDPDLVLAEATSWLWEELAGSGFAQSGRQSRMFPSGPAAMVWRRSPQATVAWIAGSQALRTQWLPAVGAVTEPRHARVALATVDGQPIVDAIPFQERAAVRLASKTGVPWTIQVANSDRRQYYELLHGESQRLRRLVETLLNFGRLEAGHMEFRFDPVEMGALTRQVVDEFAVSPAARRHQVQVTMGDGSISLMADREVLRTVIWNLRRKARIRSLGLGEHPSAVFSPQVNVAGFAT